MRIIYVGISLFSQAVASQVSSALLSLTSVFGMGTGGPSAPSTPTLCMGFSPTLPIFITLSCVNMHRFLFFLFLFCLFNFYRFSPVLFLQISICFSLLLSLVTRAGIAARCACFWFAYPKAPPFGTKLTAFS